MYPIAPIVDLGAINQQAEIVIRAGDLSQSLVQARVYLQKGYGVEPQYPNAFGLSIVFRAGATWDELAKAAQFPNGKLSIAHIVDLVQSLAPIGYELVLFITPDPNIPNHHTLGVAIGGQVQQSLSDVAAEALLNVLKGHVVSNPYQRKRP